MLNYIIVKPTIYKYHLMNLNSESKHTVNVFLTSIVSVYICQDHETELKYLNYFQIYNILLVLYMLISYFHESL